MKWRSHASAQLNRYRGQRANRWQIDMAQARYSELNKGIDAMLNIASQPMGDWQFKGEMVDGIIGYLQSLR